MPALLVIAASGTAQRRLLEETAAELEKKGYAAAGRQEGGEWNSLLSDNMTGGLFDESRYIVVESAPLMGAFPEKLSSMIEQTSSVVIVLVYESDAKSRPEKFIPKDLLKKCKVIKAKEFPRWPRERIRWTLELSKELGINLTRDGAAMVIELLEDPEEIRSQLKSLGMLKKGAPITADDAAEMCLDDGGRNLLRLLDGLCTGDIAGVLKSIRLMQRTDDLIPTLVPIHNRMRLAWYAGLGQDAMLFSKALGAKDYAMRMARQADRRCGHAALTEFMSSLMRINIEERSGTGAGWHSLEAAVIEFMSHGA